MKEKRLNRKIIIKTLVRSLEPLDYVHAFWEGGAAAFNRVDKWSDIDLYLVVDDEKVSEVFLDFERALETLSPIKQKYKVKQTIWANISQTFYRLKDTSSFLLIDLAVLKINNQEKFLVPEIHGEAKFYFNKSDKIKVPHLDLKAMKQKLSLKLTQLKAKFELFNVFVLKEILRGNDLQALDLYHKLTLASLVEILRMKYHPVHHEFKLQYINYELPSEIIEKLKNLYFVQNMTDLQEKYNAATKWFNEIERLQREQTETEKTHSSLI
jgi:hypothetical protein